MFADETLTQQEPDPACQAPRATEPECQDSEPDTAAAAVNLNIVRVCQFLAIAARPTRRPAIAT